MKKILFGLIATVIFGFAGNANIIIEKSNQKIVVKTQLFKRV